MSFDGRAVANFVLDICDENNRPITNLSLQKVVFFCHAWSLVKLGKPLIKHQFEAWQFGPVLQYLYRDFKKFDRDPIASRATKLDPHTGGRSKVQYDFDVETEALLRHIVGFYGRLSAGTLVELSHVDEGPWHKTWHHRAKINPGMKIDDKLIASYYSKTRTPF